MIDIWYTVYIHKDVPQDIIELLQVYGKNYYIQPSVKEEFDLPCVFREEDHIGNYKQLKDYLQNEQKRKERDYRRNKTKGSSD